MLVRDELTSRQQYRTDRDWRNPNGRDRWTIFEAGPATNQFCDVGNSPLLVHKKCRQS
jgi:hypothetical protein